MFVSKESTVRSVHNAQLAGLGPSLAHVVQAQLRNCLRKRFVEEVSSWKVLNLLSPFTRRVTVLEWHPVYHNVVAFASHGGDIQLWNLENSTRNVSVKGLGYGYGCVTAMKFHPENARYVYTTSVDGRFVLEDLEGRQSKVFLDTQDIHYWWCSLDLSRHHNVIFVGGNTGQAVLLDSQGEVVCKYKRLHRGKIKYAEFCPFQNLLLATASVDHTVGVWDIRMLRSKSGDCSDRPEPLHALQHSAPVNSATFDPHTGSHLLTTSQNNQMTIFNTSYLEVEENPATIIPHPHRHYQHMTDITATWHPIHQDLCVIGRYPEKTDVDQSRTIDIINVGLPPPPPPPATTTPLAQLSSPTLKGIKVLNKFSRCGRWLATGMGYTCLIWGPSEHLRAVSKNTILSNTSGFPLKDSKTARQKRKRRKKDGEIEDDGESKVAKKLKQMSVNARKKKL